MSDKVSEYFNAVLPLSGGPGTVQQATLGVSTTATGVDLRTVFGNLGIGDFLTIKAEGPAAGQLTPSGINWKAYLSLGARAGALSSGQSGLTPAASGFQAWPLSDMQEIKGHLLAGKAQTFATSPSLIGFSSMLDHRILNISCSVGSGLLHVARSTLPAGNMDASQFRPPVGSAIFPPGPSGWVGPYP